MKCRLFFLCLALALLLTGCGLVPSEYDSVSPHADSYSQPSKDEEITVNSYAELKSSLLALIDEGVEESTLTTDVYSGDVEADFNRAVESITHDLPEQAYLVSGIRGEIVSAGSYSRIDLKIRYRHEKSELQNVVKVYSMEDVVERVREALEASEETLLLHVYDYEDMDFKQLVKSYSQDNLTSVIAEPDTVLKRTFPNEGSDRILELRFVYPLDYKSLSSRKQFLDYMIDSAKDNVSAAPDDLERARQLYSLQIGGHSYSEESTDTPAFDLFVERKGDSRAFSAVYQAMCEGAKVNCVTVHGTKDGEPYDWNILVLESGVWHVDVNADAQSGAAELRFMTDAEMAGYEWDRDAYPACVGLFAPAEPPKDENAPANGEQSPEGTEGEPQVPEPAPEPPEEENPNKPENTP